MKRIQTTYLEKWLDSGPSRKPLVMRGARQVGKTWLVRNLAATRGKQLIELNFEKNPEYASLFNVNDPTQIITNLDNLLQQKIVISESLLFLDEIQAFPALLSKLRWFAEEMPELPVIAAGSLLEFMLAEYSFSMPVGRITYMYVEPLSFEDFLLAHDREINCEYLAKYAWDSEIPEVIHNKFISVFKEYMVVGGMPAAVASWITQRSLTEVNVIQRDIITTYRDDFTKYRGRIAIERLWDVMNAVPKLLGNKFVYSQVNPAANAQSLKQALHLLNQAKVCHQVVATAGNGVPLAAETNPKYFKVIFLDTGLASAALGLMLTQVNSMEDLILVNKGNIAEQVAGQLLRTITPAYVDPHLYYWQRSEAGSAAEIDYLIQHQGRIIPIEVKAGSTGTLKSLHLFMGLKNLPLAIRINADLPSKTAIKVKDSTGKLVEYTLLSLPFYLMGQIPRLLDMA